MTALVGTTNAGGAGPKAARIMHGLVKCGARISYVLAVIYVCYAWYTYSGLYQLLAEWQLDTFGAYDLKVTFVALDLNPHADADLYFLASFLAAFWDSSS